MHTIIESSDMSGINKVFKFGGASVKDAAAVRNLADIVSSRVDENILLVVSAMGKTTNLLEKILAEYRRCDQWLTHKDGGQWCHQDR